MLRRVLVALSALLAMSQNSCEARENLPSTSLLSVLLPTPLAQDMPSSNDIDHSLTMYDMFAQSSSATKSSTGTIIYVPWSTSNPCKLEYDRNTLQKAAMYLIDRNLPECSLVQAISRLRNAEVVLIGDDVCQCSRDMLPPLKFRKECEALAKNNSSRLAGEGSPCSPILPRLQSKLPNEFMSLKIPTVLIDWVVATQIKSCLNGVKPCTKDSVVVGRFMWGLKKKQVFAEMWTAAESDTEFKRAFAPLARKLDQRLVFQPRFVLYDAKEWGCSSLSLHTPFCSTSCVKERYCTPGSMTVNGKTSLEETLRQICIYEQASLITTSARGWWDYVDKFGSLCGPRNFTQSCSESVQRMVPGISVEATRACEQNSWKADNYNQLFQIEISDRSNSLATIHPALAISGFIVRHFPKGAAFSTTSVLSQICDQFNDPPPVCACVNGVSSIRDCGDNSCDATERLCLNDRKCYPDDEDFPVRCSSCPANQEYCPSTRSCTTTCPKCADKTKPYYCVITAQCVHRVLDCVIPNNSTGGGDSSGPSPLPPSAVASIVVVVIFTVAILAYAIWWRQQRSKFRSEVFEIMEQYRPLDRAGSISRANHQQALIAT